MDNENAKRERRDSLFLLATLRLGLVELPVKVRNLSSGGAMLEGVVSAKKGAPVSLNIRNIGWVDGDIAWVEGARCGISFRDQIDPQAARIQISATDSRPAQSQSFRTGLRRI